MWDPGMAHAMVEMICTDGLRQDVSLQEAVEAEQPLSWSSSESGSCPGSVRPALLDLIPSCKAGERSWQHCKKVGYTSAGEGTRVGNHLDECLSNHGGLFRYLFEDFFIPPWTFSSGLGFVATNWIIVFQAAWAAAFSWKELSSFYSSLLSYSPLC